MIVAPLGAPPPSASPAPARPDDLAFELGRGHALRQLCEGRGDGLWRERMQRLLDAEGAQGARRQALVLRFNAGFADARTAFPTCGDPARAALKESAARGADLAHRLAAAPRP